MWPNRYSPRPDRATLKARGFAPCIRLKPICAEELLPSQDEQVVAGGLALGGRLSPSIPVSAKKGAHCISPLLTDMSWQKEALGGIPIPAALAPADFGTLSPLPQAFALLFLQWKYFCGYRTDHHAKSSAQDAASESPCLSQRSRTLHRGHSRGRGIGPSSRRVGIIGPSVPAVRKKKLLPAQFSPLMPCWRKSHPYI